MSTPARPSAIRNSLRCRAPRDAADERHRDDTCTCVCACVSKFRPLVFLSLYNPVQALTREQRTGRGDAGAQQQVARAAGAYRVGVEPRIAAARVEVEAPGR